MPEKWTPADPSFPVSGSDVEDVASILSGIRAYRADGRGGWIPWVKRLVPAPPRRYYALLRKYLPLIAAAFDEDRARYIQGGYVASGRGAFGRLKAGIAGESRAPTIAFSSG